MLGRRTGGPADWRTVRKNFLAALRRVAGMPDYDAYVEHLRLAHPDRQVPTRDQFYQEYLEARYRAGPTRCC